MRFAAWLALSAAWTPRAAALEESQSPVVVVYNAAMRDSRALAEYYAGKRGIPTNQLVGLRLPETESISRSQYREQLEKPLLKAFEAARWFTWRMELSPATRERAGELKRQVVASKIRYLVPCYGVPVHILEEPGWKEAGSDNTRPEFRRNEAAVDSELAVLPLSVDGHPLNGPMRNPLLGATNLNLLSPVNGLLMVARLDGPSVGVARGLVDKALAAETNGLWGRAYFDARGLTNSDYKRGDEWILSAAMVARADGFETIVDTNVATFPAAFPLSQVALYAGWYDTHVSGPFARPQVEFMPGAIAYHLHSFSAQVLRTNTLHWAGPLLAKGAAATMGCVAEPYLDLTPNMAVFFAHLIRLGATLGEAAYASMPAVSWQITVVGDPLYRPFGKRADAQHLELAQRNDPLIAWSHLRVVNRNLELGRPAAEMLDYLEREPWTAKSAVLQEKLAQLFWQERRWADAARASRAALELQPTPQQRVRLLLALSAQAQLAGDPKGAAEACRRLIKECSDYPDRAGVEERLVTLVGNGAPPTP